MRWVATLVIVLAAAAAAVLVNVVLLNTASSGSDPVGKLAPTASLPAAPSLRAPPGVIQPSSGPVRGERNDD
jgi:hypothetical protein